MLSGEVDLVINTSEGKDPFLDSYAIRRTAVERGLPYITTLAGAEATAKAVESLLRSKSLTVTALQDYHNQEAN